MKTIDDIFNIIEREAADEVAVTYHENEKFYTARLRCHMADGPTSAQAINDLYDLLLIDAKFRLNELRKKELRLKERIFNRAAHLALCGEYSEDE